MPLPSTMTPIATNTLTTATASVTFSNLPQGYTDLVLVISARMTAGGGASAVQLEFHGDTGSNYSVTTLNGDGTSATSARNSNQTVAGLGLATDASGQWSTNVMQIMNYANTTTNKTVIARSGIAGDRVRAQVGLWRNTSAITSIKISNNGATTFVLDSTFTIYGVKAA